MTVPHILLLPMERILLRFFLGGAAGVNNLRKKKFIGVAAWPSVLGRALYFSGYCDSSVHQVSVKLAYVAVVQIVG